VIPTPSSDSTKQKREISRQQAWDAYISNLEYVLEDISILLDNLDSQSVVITSDHGNSFGEWNVYGHPPGCPIEVVRSVPWIEVEASDSGRYSPDVSSTEDRNSEESIEERLHYLGYS
jgi:arylsulfatase A-like enzyme